MNTHQHSALFITTACTLALGMALSNTYLLGLGIEPVQAIMMGGEQPITATRSVLLDDLEIATPAGREALTSRLRRAAQAVCDEVSPARRWQERKRQAQCQQSVLRDALARVYSPGGTLTDPDGATGQARHVKLTAHR